MCYRIDKSIVLLVASALLVVVVMAIASEPLRVFLKGFGTVFSDLWRTVSGWF